MSDSKNSKLKIEYDNKREMKEEPNFQDLNSIKFKEVKGGDTSFEKTIEIFINPEETQEEAEKKIKEKLTQENWWFREYWRKKGKPNEQISIKINEIKIDIYNWSNFINDEQLEKIKDIFKKFLLINEGEVLKKTRYFLVDNISKTHYYTGEEMNGDATGSRHDKSIKLYPRAFQNIEHRVPGVSNLEGTLIHELSHQIRLVKFEILNEWKKKFGWKPLEKERRTPGGELQFDEIDDPSRLVSELATYNPEEDFCESMVAALKNPKILDPERLKFIKENILGPISKEKYSYKVEKRTGNKEVVLPEIESPVRFKRKVKTERLNIYN